MLRARYVLIGFTHFSSTGSKVHAVREVGRIRELENRVVYSLIWKDCSWISQEVCVCMPV